MPDPRLIAACLAAALLTACAGKQGGSAAHDQRPIQRGSVIFLHPDGTSAANFAIGRALFVGPDNDLNWDKMPAMAVYRGHMKDSLTATSNGGATTHAFGLKVKSGAYGMSAAGDLAQPLVDEQGRSLSVAKQAVRRGIPVGLVQTGTNTEPGTGCFVTAVRKRAYHDKIADQLIHAGVKVILGGGERYFLPEGAEGVHGPGVREDGRNLVEEARALGYAVVYNAEQLDALPDDTDMVLGLFASNHTFNDLPEETLKERGLPQYFPDAPTVARMTDKALAILTHHDERFFLVVEEEGTDNFGNKNNASGMLEAMRRADEAIGLCQRFIKKHPRTLLLTAADSDAGAARLVGFPVGPGRDVPEALPAVDRNGAPVDGVDGTGSAPFIAKPDRFGQRLPFAVVWATHDDASGGVLVRAQGLNHQRVRGNMDNTELTDLMRLTLFGTTRP